MTRFDPILKIGLHFFGFRTAPWTTYYFQEPVRHAMCTVGTKNARSAFLILILIFSLLWAGLTTLKRKPDTHFLITSPVLIQVHFNVWNDIHIFENFGFPWMALKVSKCLSWVPKLQNSSKRTPRCIDWHIIFYGRLATISVRWAEVVHTRGAGFPHLSTGRILKAGLFALKKKGLSKCRNAFVFRVPQRGKRGGHYLSLDCENGFPTLKQIHLQIPTLTMMNRSLFSICTHT